MLKITPKEPLEGYIIENNVHDPDIDKDEYRVRQLLVGTPYECGISYNNGGGIFLRHKDTELLSDTVHAAEKGDLVVRIGSAKMATILIVPEKEISRLFEVTE